MQQPTWIFRLPRSLEYASLRAARRRMVLRVLVLVLMYLAFADLILSMASFPPPEPLRVGIAIALVSVSFLLIALSAVLRFTWFRWRLMMGLLFVASAAAVGFGFHIAGLAPFAGPPLLALIDMLAGWICHGRTNPRKPVRVTAIVFDMVWLVLCLCAVGGVLYANIEFREIRDHPKHEMLEGLGAAVLVLASLVTAVAGHVMGVAGAVLHLWAYRADRDLPTGAFPVEVSPES